MMIKKIFVFTIYFISTLLFYAYGYYSGVNDVIIFDSTLNSNVGINVITLLERAEYNKAIEYQKDNVEVNIAALDDVIKKRSSVLEFPGRYLKYRDHYSIDLTDKYEKINDRFKAIKGVKK